MAVLLIVLGAAAAFVPAVRAARIDPAGLLRRESDLRDAYPFGLVVSEVIRIHAFSGTPFEPLISPSARSSAVIVARFGQALLQVL